MTQRGRNGIAQAGDWLTRYPFILPIAIMVVGGVFRFYNLNWDDGHQLHPDERWIFMVVSGANNNPPISWPTSWAQFTNVQQHTGSPLDPHFFAYGSLPFYLLALVAGAISFLGQHVWFLSQWSQVSSYGGLPMLARGLSACLDLLSVGIVFFIGRRIYGYWTGVLAMALAAFTVLDIQLAHFFTVDTVLLPFVLLSLLAAVIIAQTNTQSAYLWGGVAFGAALATKTTALLLVIPLAAAGVVWAWNSEEWPAEGRLPRRLLRHYAAIGPRLNRNLFNTLTIFSVAALTFAVCEPYAILDRSQLVHDIAEQTSILVNNDGSFGVPYTIQYAHTIPYLFQLENLLFWSMGIPLAAAAFAGVVFALVRNAGVRLRPGETICTLWIVPYFLFVGRFLAKFNRYMLPIIPVMIILGAAFMVWLIRRSWGWRRRLAWAALIAVTGLSFLYSLAYMNIYAHPNTRVAASRWIYAHIPAGASIAVETPWDDPLPLDVPGHSASEYHPINLSLYDPDTQAKIALITNALTHADYIVMSSERMIGSIPKLPDRYPITTRYYDLLLGGKLNFRLVRHFQEHPQLGPVVVQDYAADESFHVYDHPNVRIFKRVSSITPARVAALLSNAIPPSGQVTAPSPAPVSPAAGPDTRLMLSQAQWKKDQSGPTMDQMFPPAGFAMKHPVIIWLLMLEFLGLLAFPVTFMLLRNLPDRGFVVAKTFGLLLAGFFVWIAARLGLAYFDRSLIVAVVALLALLSAGLALYLRPALAAFFRLEWRRVLAGELVFLAGFALFVVLRMWYPDLGHQFSPVSASNPTGGRMGEKQMELAFLNAIVRSRVFPPYDPFFAHGYINYYYYGFFLVGMLCKLAQIAPATGFNLAIATFFALLVANVFSVALGLTRRITPGILAALFVGVFGNLNGAWQLMRQLVAIGPTDYSFPILGGVLARLTPIPVLGGILRGASGLWEVATGHQTLQPFDFWEPTRIVPPIGNAISEFPYFTYLFADLHPHLMAYPMTAAALALATSLALGSAPGLRYAALCAVLGALLLGAIAVTNPWDYPTYLGIVGLGALVGVYALRRRFDWRELGGAALWLAAMAVLSVLLYLPFKQDYQTVFTTGVSLVRTVTPQLLESGGVPANQVHDAVVTPLRIYLEHFGFFVFVLVSLLVLLLVVDAGLGARLRRWVATFRFAIYYRDRLRQVYQASRVARRLLRPKPPVIDGPLFIGFAIIALGLAALQYFLLAFTVALLGLTILLLLRLGRQLSTAQLFVLVLALVPVGLSIATQVVFVRDFLAGGPGYRMNTIFKFYNQAWVLYAVVSAVALYQFVIRQTGAGDARSTESGETRRRWGQFSRSSTGSDTGRRGSGYPDSVHDDSELPQSGSASFRVADEVGPAFALAPSGTRLEPIVMYQGADGLSPRAASAMPEPVEESHDVVVSAHRTVVSVPFLAAGGPLRQIFDRRPFWSACLVLLVLGSLIYTFAGTVARETYRTTWLPENSVPFTLDGMAFMKVAYPGDYAGITWLNAHVHGAQVIAEADDAYYNWKSRVSMFTGLPTIINGIHEAEQRFPDQPGTRAADVNTLYSSSSISDAWRIIRTYGVRYIFVGFSETHCADTPCYPKIGLAKFDRMVGHGLVVAYRHPGVTIYKVSTA